MLPYQKKHFACALTFLKFRRQFWSATNAYLRLRKFASRRSRCQDRCVSPEIGKDSRLEVPYQKLHFCQIQGQLRSLRQNLLQSNPAQLGQRPSSEPLKFPTKWALWANELANAASEAKLFLEWKLTLELDALQSPCNKGLLLKKKDRIGSLEQSRKIIQER